MNAHNASISLADVQSITDLRNIPINQVGIKDLRHPICVTQPNGELQHAVAHFNMYVELPPHFKGTHMSRFVEILHEEEATMTADTFRNILGTMLKRLNAKAGHLEMAFPYFVLKRAPVSGVSSWMDYPVRWIGKVEEDRMHMSMKIIIPVTTLCPCSKQISHYGAHNQRAHVTVEAEIKGALWMEEIIEVVEQEASSELYGLLKRPDEKYVTERAYDNPKFVEDLVRDIAMRFNRYDKIVGYRIESENFESIHNHSAYAMVEKSKKG
ncbi:MAG: GTP cyclohydrolase I FolE2 [Gammaproteobacteria bacterium]|nr:GTP cyclohydrolase I FolE2 [Gammaproteobacteria bacterium]